MAASKNEFFSAMVPWCGKRFLVLVRSARIEFRLWGMLENVSTNGVFTFARRNEESLEIDLSASAEFSWEQNGAELVPSILHDGFERLYRAAVLVKLGDELRVTFVFPRDEVVDTTVLRS